MKLKASNPLVTFYLFNNYNQYDTWEYRAGRKPINLCNMFWNLLAKLVLLTALTLFGSILLSIVVTELGWWGVAKMAAISISILLACAAVLFGGAFCTEVITSTELWQFIKGNYCPQITLVNDDKVQAKE